MHVPFSLDQAVKLQDTKLGQVAGSSRRSGINAVTVSFLSFQSVASQIELPDEFVYYFGLFLVKKEDQKENSSEI